MEGKECPKWRAHAWGKTEPGAFKEPKEGPAQLSHREHACLKEGPRREIILPDDISSYQIPGSAPESLGLLRRTQNNPGNTTTLSGHCSECFVSITSLSPPNSPPGQIF